MAATPPLQIAAEARTPPTPLHGSVYHDEPTPSSRYQTRSGTKKGLEKSQQSPVQQSSALQLTKSHKSPRAVSSSVLHSPQATPKNRSTRRVQIISPTSPESDSFAAQNTQKLSQPQPGYLSANTIMSEGMLPTPVKTPQKKKSDKSTLAARALFQDQADTQAMAPSPRKRKNRRYNGFSLESVSAEDANNGNQLQIFTDSRDQIPQVDTSESNPFIEQHTTDKITSTQKVAGTSKRRKVSHGKKLDPQVQEAIDKDEGMVYVFRGKKIYRRFDDQGEEEEDIDIDEDDDLGLLQHSPGAGSDIRTFKTLTRKSIKPVKLFETSAQRETRLEEQDEEAETEIEDNLNGDTTPTSTKNVSKQVSNGDNVASAPPSSDQKEPHSTKSSDSAKGRGKKTSPFDAWRRIKPGSRTSSDMPSTRTRKRTAAEAVGESD